MTIDRRGLLKVLAFGLVPSGFLKTAAQGSDQWYSLSDDDGKPLPNLRLPVEITSEVDDLPGAIWVGSDRRDYTVVEFFDYNCPFCRRAASDIHALAEATPELRVGLVNNPILSSASMEAARIEAAILRLRGAQTAYAFHRRLFDRRGTINRTKALEVAEGMGLTPAELGQFLESHEIQGMLDRQVSLAASLGFAATPSFLIAGTGVLGYPGPRALGQLVRSLDECAEVVCP